VIPLKTFRRKENTRKDGRGPEAKRGKRLVDGTVMWGTVRESKGTKRDGSDMGGRGDSGEVSPPKGSEKVREAIGKNPIPRLCGKKSVDTRIKSKGMWKQGAEKGRGGKVLVLKKKNCKGTPF